MGNLYNHFQDHNTYQGAPCPLYPYQNPLFYKPSRPLPPHPSLLQPLVPLAHQRMQPPPLCCQACCLPVWYRWYCLGAGYLLAFSGRPGVWHRTGPADPQYAGCGPCVSAWSGFLFPSGIAVVDHCSGIRVKHPASGAYRPEFHLGHTGFSIAAAFATAWLLGRWLGIAPKLKLLIGVGTAICGGSAIAAVTPVIKPEEHETAFAISTIFLFNIVALLVFPALGHWMNMTDAGFGLWAGTAINDTSSVVAAAFSYSAAAGEYATIVKLTRATLIIPICLVLALWVAWKEKKQGANDFSLARIFPWFIVWFLVASAIRSVGLIPDAIQPYLQTAAHGLIIVSLTAIGLSSDMRRMATTGIRPIVLGLGVWVAVASSSLGVQALTGGW